MLHFLWTPALTAFAVQQSIATKHRIVAQRTELLTHDLMRYIYVSLFVNSPQFIAWDTNPWIKKSIRELTNEWMKSYQMKETQIKRNEMKWTGINEWTLCVGVAWFCSLCLLCWRGLVLLASLVLLLYPLEMFNVFDMFWLRDYSFPFDMFDMLDILYMASGCLTC